MKRLLTIVFVFFSSNQLHGSFSLKDEIDFFNVGQGHAVLVKKAENNDPNAIPYVPLLIDAGATSHPYIAGPKYEWNQDNSKDSSMTKISKRILEFWQSSNTGRLQSGVFNLNIIITHPDKDHKDFIPGILKDLSNKAQILQFIFLTSILLGGESDLYTDYLADYKFEKKVYSSEITGLCLKGSCGFLESSGSVTHLFCPKGIKSDPNRWSIITRVQVNGLSAILTGDADITVKSEMLKHLGASTPQLQSDILLVPHHGAEETFYLPWDQTVNPRAIVIGAAPNGKYGHPRGKTILELLEANQNQGRLWSETVQPHGIQYYCNDVTEHQLHAKFQLNKRLFDSVRNPTTETGQWHLTWVDLPLYTLWTTGTLYFSHNVKTPTFAEAPHGLMNYVAVSNPGYLFPPYARSKLTPLSHFEQELFHQITVSMRRVHETDESIQKEAQEQSITIKQNIKFIREAKEARLIEDENTLSKEVLLIDAQEDRRIYLTLLTEIMAQKDILFYQAAFLFPWMREAVTHRNKTIPSSEERLIEITRFIMLKSRFSSLTKPEGKFKFLGDKDIWDTVCCSELHEKSLILKIFLKSTHPLEKLGSYIKAYNSCACSAVEIDILCPFGFPEWIQLAKLSSFFCKVILETSEDYLTLTDVRDIIALRMQGKNFKEIAVVLIDDHAEFQAKEHTGFNQKEGLVQQFQTLSLQESKQAVFKETQKKLLEKLEFYFPSTFDDYLS